MIRYRHFNCRNLYHLNRNVATGWFNNSYLHSTGPVFKSRSGAHQPWLLSPQFLYKFQDSPLNQATTASLYTLAIPLIAILQHTAPSAAVTLDTALFTLRRRMSYIYIYIYMKHPFLMFLDHTQRRTTVGRTLLDE